MVDSFKFPPKKTLGNKVSLNKLVACCLVAENSDLPRFALFSLPAVAHSGSGRLLLNKPCAGLCEGIALVIGDVMNSRHQNESAERERLGTR